MVGIIGDPHFRENFPYGDYLPDKRKKEWGEIKNTIIESFADCDTIVFMGDNFHAKHNPSQVVREFTEFVERFGDKKIFIIAGNHEKFADGRTAVDYLGEINHPNWHIVTDLVFSYPIDHGISFTFCPYFFRQELGAQDYEEATNKLIEKFTGFTEGEWKNEKRILFVHHAVSETIANAQQVATDFFNEIVLPKKLLEKKFDFVVAGHIHKHGDYGKTLMTGNIFTDEIGEMEKFVWKLDEKTMEVTPIKLPVRPIWGLSNPSIDELISITPNRSIVKLLFTEKQDISIEEYKKILNKFDAHILVEQYPRERKKLVEEDVDILDLGIKKLLSIYAKQRKVDEKKLLNAWNTIQ